MSTLSMSSASVRSSSSAEIFSKKINFGLYLSIQKSVSFELSPVKKLPILKSADDAIWISNKLKEVYAKVGGMAFAEELAKNATAYEIGLTVPSAEYPNASWIIYKKGEQMQSTVIATISLNDTGKGEVIAAVK